MIHFLTFADKRLVASLTRIRSQAEEMAVFDELHCLNEDDLDRDFWNKWQEFIQATVEAKRRQTFGYWVWKPQVVLQTLEQMADGDILLYCDVGCHLNKFARDRLVEHIESVRHSESGILAFRMGYLERNWTKGDLFDHFDVRNDTEITHTGQRWAGAFLARKCDTSVAFFEQWLAVFENPHLIDDTPSVSPNFIGFTQHRHDQSAFSILCKLHNIDSVREYQKTGDYPILAKSDKEWN
jgi:hypothetical protein